MLGLGGKCQIRGIKDRPLAAVQLMGLHADLGRDNGPLTRLERHVAVEITDHSLKGNVVLTAGHHVAADDKRALAKGFIARDHTLKFHGLTVVALHLLGKIAVEVTSKQ